MTNGKHGDIAKGRGAGSDHYDIISAATVQSGAGKKQILDKNQFRRELGTWGYALIISLLPFIIVFFLFTGPPKKFEFLELFQDNTLFYVCVTMSALSFYTYKGMNLLAGTHISVIFIGIVLYFFSTNGIDVPLFKLIDRRAFIAVFLLISILLSFFTLLYYSATKIGEKS